MRGVISLREGAVRDILFVCFVCSTLHSHFALPLQGRRKRRPSPSLPPRIDAVGIPSGQSKGVLHLGSEVCRSLLPCHGHADSAVLKMSSWEYSALHFVTVGFLKGEVRIARSQML